MVIRLKPCFATEDRPIEWCIDQISDRKIKAHRLLLSINQLKCLSKDVKILELGCAQGLFLIALQELGFDCTGIEPSENANLVREELSNLLKITLKVKNNFAEDLHFENETFDLIIADSVLEHVFDVEKVISETFRVLKQGGIFYFSTASSMCPYQQEIRFLPFFSWYPKFLKIKIMKWAVENQPSLIGYTRSPAINWFTPWKANKLLKKAGYGRIFDVWDYLNTFELSGAQRKLLTVIRKNNFLKIIGQICIPTAVFIAIKD